MAQITGTLKTLGSVDAVENVGGLPLPGPLVTPFVAEVPDRIIGSHVPNRFPTPPAAFGFLSDFYYLGLEEFPIRGDNIQRIVTGAVYPEATHLEPTLGQIWPRIG